jgi:SAM-dependent methyltransferase
VDLVRHTTYDINWILANQMGLNPLLLTEWNLQNVPVAPDWNVCDIACGRALSSIFIAREWGCRTWAVDAGIDPSGNWARVKEAGVEALVTPLKANARDLPLPREFFDLIICTDAFIYFGTDDLYIPYVAKYLKPAGYLAFTVPGYPNEEPERLPDHLRPFWADECWPWHTREWWVKHVERSEYFKVTEAEVLENGIDVWIDWKKLRREKGDMNKSIDTDLEVMRADKGRYLGFIKTVAQRAK